MRSCTVPGVDEELQRLETVLGAYPDDRALPDVDDILAEAGIDARVIEEDERARKLLLDAVTTRPFGSLDEVRRVATEVELLVIEVRQLAASLRQPDGLDASRREHVDQRLTWARRRLQQLLDRL